MSNIKGSHLTEEHKRKIGLANQGKVISDETRKKMSLAKIGKQRPIEIRKKISESHKGKPFSEEHRARISAAKKGKPLSEEVKAHLSVIERGEGNPMYGRHHSGETRVKISMAKRGKCSEKLLAHMRKLGILHKGHAAWNKGMHHSKEAIAKISASSLAKWRDPEFILRIMQSRRRRPTKPESLLQDILMRYFPEFKYNGNFDLGISIGGLIPDFINVNGKKEVIELFGDYFHSPEVIGNRWQGGELGRIMAYNSVGYQCLVIWESELKELPEEQIITKINSLFTKRRNKKG